jgi:catechol 2,3-dioxygenase-like lactoylglutathione lyase family enzyme
MQIIGPELLVFGVDDVPACHEFLTAYGLEPVGYSPENGGFFRSLDGTGLEIRRRDDPALPPALKTGNMLRLQVLGVVDEAALEAVAAELSKDRQVLRLADGSLRTQDDQGFELSFRVTTRTPLDLPAERVNAPYDTQRPVNQVGVSEDMPAKPRTLSHVVLFVPDVDVAVGFYRDRLGFRITDTLTGAGPFLRPQANTDHHSHFFIRTPVYMQGCEHLAFHMGGPTELLMAGTRMMRGGFESFWGPGRHKFGSNWFWYFKSPLGCNVEFDADMDTHDDDWAPREAPMGPEAAQAFLFQYREKWAPGPGPKPGA